MNSHLSEQECERLAEHVRDSIAAGRWPSDASFDRLLPTRDRSRSNAHWTQLCAARRAAGWFRDLDIQSVVDVGSGAGKFCVGAALAGDADYLGLEQRPRLVAVARALAARLRVSDRVRFEAASFGDDAVPDADAYYFYNPFGENLFGWSEQVDWDVELTRSRYVRDVKAAEAFLAALPPGRFLVTYNGFGGHVPVTFREVRVDRELPSVLRIFRKVVSP